MSKKFIIILISSVLGLLLLSLVGYYFILQSNDTTPAGEKPTGFRSFFPFGGDDTPEPTQGEEETPIISQPNVQVTEFTQKLRRLSIEPVAGAGTKDIQAGTLVRYIEKATGHIFEVELFSPKIGRISNTTIPLVYNAMWGNENNSLIANYLQDDDSTIDTYSITLKNLSTTTENIIAGVAFPGGINDVSVSDTSVFYLQQSSGLSQGYTSLFDGTKKKLIWSSEIKELNSQFVNAKTVALTTKSYPNIDGYLYFVDTGTGSMKRILGNIPGLSTLVNPLATAVLALEQTNGVQFFTYDVKTKAIIYISPVTFPEKCVWSKKDPTIAYCAVPKEILNNNSLTLWYQGQTSYSDDIWKYNLKDNTSSIFTNLSDLSGVKIDAIKPILSANEQYLVFINKIDNTLWSLDITK